MLQKSALFVLSIVAKAKVYLKSCFTSYSLYKCTPPRKRGGDYDVSHSSAYRYINHPNQINQTNHSSDFVIF